MIPRHRSLLLAADAAVNLLLGMILVVAPRPVATALGLPVPASRLYVGAFGAVLIGVGLALLLERARGRGGLGLGGAVAINLCAAVFVAAWLVAGGDEVTGWGVLFLALLVVLLIVLSAAELWLERQGSDAGAPSRPT